MQSGTGCLAVYLSTCLLACLSAWLKWGETKEGKRFGLTKVMVDRVMQIEPCYHRSVTTNWPAGPSVEAKPHPARHTSG